MGIHRRWAKGVNSADFDAGKSSTPMFEALEPRILLDSAPFIGAQDYHDETDAIVVGIADVGSDSSIDATAGSIYHNNWNYSVGPIGVSGLGVYDAIWKHFTVPQSGEYRVTYSGSITGEFWNVSSSLIIGGSMGGGDIKLKGRLIGEDGSEAEQILYETELTLGSFVQDLILAELTGLLGVGDVVSALQTLDSATTPEASWNALPFQLDSYAHLEAGQTHTWSISALSVLATDALGIASQASVFDINIDLDQVSIVHLDASSPRLESLFYSGSPFPVVQGGQLLLSASATDPDGSVDRVEFYRDANGNGVLEIGVDEYVGSDSSVQGGQWDWYGDVRWSQGTHTFFARARDNEGIWSNPSSIFVSIGSTPAQEGNDFTHTDTEWDDDSYGDDDAVMESGERVHLKIELESEDGATDVDAVLSSTDPDINIIDSDVHYYSFSPGQQRWCVGSFDMELDFALSPGQTRNRIFTLHVTYELGGMEYYQDLTFNKTFYRDGDVSADFQVVGDVVIDDSVAYFYRNNGDGILQSGEQVRIRPEVENSGTNHATDPDIEFYYSGPGESPVDIRGDAQRYEDLPAGQSGYPEDGDYYRVYVSDWTFTGLVSVGMLVDWDENNSPDPVDIPDAFQIYIEAAPILSVDPRTWDFGVVAPGVDVVGTMRVRNHGSAPLIVTDIQTFDADTTVAPGDKSFTLQPAGTPGDYRDVDVTVDTAAIPSGTTINRTAVVISDAAWSDNTPPNNQFVITGLVSNTVLTYTIPGTVSPQNPDISGHLIAFRDVRDGNSDIYLYNTLTGEERRITTDPSSQDMPRISGDLIVWEDLRNDDGSRSNHDIYGYHLQTDQEFAVSIDPANDELIGIDDGLAAFVREYYEFTESSNHDSARNLLVCEYEGAGVWSTRYDSSFTVTPGHDTKQTVGDDGDIGGGLLVFERFEVYWSSEYEWWNTRGRHQEVIDFAAGDGSPRSTDVGSTWPDPAATYHRFAYVDDYEDPQGYSGDQIWIWDNGTPQRITSPGTEEVDHANSILAISGDLIVYDKAGEPEVYYWDLSSGKEHVLTDEYTDPDYARMDGKGVTWEGSGPTIYYAFLQQPDLDVSGVAFSDDSPAEGDTIDVSVIVRNLTDYAATDDITVRLYDGDPDTGGAQLAPDQIIPGGLAAQSQTTVPFLGVTVPDNTGAGETEPRQIYARLSVPGFDNPDNDTASGWLTVADDDTVGPAISNVLVVEQGGDGDGTIGADEQLRISWDLSDPKGINSALLWVDADGDGLGVPGFRDPDDMVTLDGDYHATLGPLAAGEYDYAIDASDADNSPAFSQYLDSFEVVPAEDITILYDGDAITGGETVDLGAFGLGATDGSVVFIVRNDGEQALSLGEVTTSAGLIATDPPSSTVAPGDTTHFLIQLSTASPGPMAGSVSLPSSDPDNSPFSFSVSWTVLNPPVANDDDVIGVVEDGGPVAIDVLANDTYLPDPPQQLTITGVTDAPHGTVAIIESGGRVRYTPDPDHFGADSFTYTITDEDSLTATATVNVTVDPVPDDPVWSVVPSDQTMSHNEDTCVVTVIATDADGDTVSYSAEVIDPETEAATLRDSLGLVTRVSWRDTASQRWFRNNSWQNYAVQTDGTVIREGGAVVGQVDASYYADPDSLLTAVASSGPTPATVSIVGNQLTVDPDASFEGTFKVEVTATDGAATITDSFEVTVTNSPPVWTAFPSDQTMSHNEDTRVVTVSATDADGDPVTYDAVVVDPETEAANLRDSLGLVARVTWRDGSGHRWFRNNSWQNYAVQTDGTVIREGGAVVGQVDVSYYAHPDSLLTAVAGSGPAPATVSIVGTQLTVDPDASFEGTFKVEVTATDGAASITDSFKVTVTNSVPAWTVFPSDQVMSHNEDTRTVTVSATDADGDPVSYEAVVIDPETEAATLRDDLGLVERTTWKDWTGERWFRNASWQHYGIRSDGTVIQEGGAVVGQVDVSYYANPDSLLTAVAGSGPAPATVSIVGTQLTVDPDASFEGTCKVEVTATDGVATVTDSFEVTVTNDPPVWLVAPPDQTMSQSEDTRTVTVIATDADGDPISYGAVLIDPETEAATLRDDLGLVERTTWKDWTGERWFRNASWQHYGIRSDGTVIQEGGAVVGQLDVSYYANPDSLLTAVAGSGPAPATVSIVGTQLTVDPDASFEGTFKVEVTATDGAASISDVFEVTVMSP